MSDEVSRRGSDSGFDEVSQSRQHSRISSKSMHEALVEQLTERGLTLVRREDSDEEEDIEPVDEKYEEAQLKMLFQEYSQLGLNWNIANPHETPLTPSGNVYSFPLRSCTLYEGAVMLTVDVSEKTVHYTNNKAEIIKTRALAGSKVSPDVVSKHMFCIWFKGDKIPCDHTLWEEGYRNHVVDVLCIKKQPPFQIVTVHKDMITRKTPSLSKAKRFAKLVNGMLLLYKDRDDMYPVEGFCLLALDMAAKKGGLLSSSVQLRGRERGVQLGVKNKAERERWSVAIGAANERGRREWDLLSRHLHMVRKEAQRKRQMTRRKTGHLSASSSMSSMSVADGKHDAQQNHSGTSASKATPTGTSGPYQGGWAEFVVQLDGPDGPRPIGYMEVSNNMSLQRFRERMLEELDNLPPSFRFLRKSVPVGQRQEPKKSIAYVATDDQQVFIREADND